MRKEMLRFSSGEGSIWDEMEKKTVKEEKIEGGFKRCEYMDSCLRAWDGKNASLEFLKTKASAKHDERNKLDQEIFLIEQKISDKEGSEIAQAENELGKEMKLATAKGEKLNKLKKTFLETSNKTYKFTKKESKKLLKKYLETIKKENVGILLFLNREEKARN